MDCEEGEMHCDALVNHLIKSHGAVLVDLETEISEEFVPVTLKGLVRDAGNHSYFPCTINKNFPCAVI